MRFETITTLLDLAGVLANAILGGAIARRRELDLFGFLVIGGISGLGGGVLRDTLLQQGPPVALMDPFYIPTALAGACLAFVLNLHHRAWNRVFDVLDAAALSLWAAAGAQMTLSAGLGSGPAILLGTLTAVGGGAIRDLLLQRVPAILGGNALYASIAVLVASLQVLCSALGAPLVVGTAVGIMGGSVLRLIAAWRGWSLPNGLDWKPRETLTKVVQYTSIPHGDELRRQRPHRREH
ncbi:trimeric intracellular cation channel family protein [Spirillospora sp. NPDC050679]